METGAWDSVTMSQEDTDAPVLLDTGCHPTVAPVRMWTNVLTRIIRAKGNTHNVTTQEEDTNVLMWRWDTIDNNICKYVLLSVLLVIKEKMHTTTDARGQTQDAELLTSIVLESQFPYRSMSCH